MNTPAKLAGFAAALAIVFGGAAVAGDAIDADAPEATQPATNEGMAMGTHGEDATTHTNSEAESHPVRGLAVADDGLRVVVADPELRRGARETLRFRIVDEAGQTVRDFDVEHTKRMHLIVVRRDLTGFQHLHPTQAPDGSWSTPLRLTEPGSYRIFADFSRDEEPHTLAADLRVDGAADLVALPEPSPVATSDGYDVELDASGGPLRFSITRDGKPVKVDPYLGANGHLVALREGDLAFLHVHPMDDGVTFDAEFPSSGRYRLFLQFKHEGKVHTVAFTRKVA